jgi:hypothetical protein
MDTFTEREEKVVALIDQLTAAMREFSQLYGQRRRIIGTRRVTGARVSREEWDTLQDNLRVAALRVGACRDALKAFHGGHYTFPGEGACMGTFRELDHLFGTVGHDE